MSHDSPEAISPGSSRLQRVLREPLLQFLLLGLALFGASAAISNWRAAHEQRIVIDAPLVTWQRNLYHAQFGTWPDNETLEALLQNHVRDEVLYREAVRLGLGADDEVIRQRLIQKMEFVLSDAVQPPEPDDATLQSFLAQHARQYADPGRVSFQLLYFADQPDAAAAKVRAEEALRQLAAGAKTVRSDPFALGESWSQQSADELKRSFGDSPMAAEPLHAPLHQWVGPLRSGYGWHLIRVTARGASTLPNLASLRERLRTDWQADFRERDRDARIAALIARHQVVRLDQQASP
jgi:hypothetical protein